MIARLRLRLSRPAVCAAAPELPMFVGWCAACEAPMLLAPDRDEASCPCGAARVPREFMVGV